MKVTLIPDNGTFLELYDKFDKLYFSSGERARYFALKGGASLILNEAIRRAPVRRGTLRRSMHIVVKSRYNTTETQIGTDIEYAPYLEFGTSRMAARPFLRPAFDYKKREAVQLAASIFKAGIK